MIHLNYVVIDKNGKSHVKGKETAEKLLYTKHKMSKDAPLVYDFFVKVGEALEGFDIVKQSENTQLGGWQITSSEGGSMATNTNAVKVSEYHDMSDFLTAVSAFSGGPLPKLTDDIIKGGGLINKTVPEGNKAYKELFGGAAFIPDGRLTLEKACANCGKILRGNEIKTHPTVGKGHKDTLVLTPIKENE